MEFLIALSIVGILSIIIVDKEKQIKRLEEEANVQKNIYHDFDRVVFSLVLNNECVLSFIDGIEDENEKEKFSKYVLEHGFTDSTLRFINYIKDEELKKYCMYEYKSALDKLRIDYSRFTITSKIDQERSN